MRSADSNGRGRSTAHTTSRLLRLAKDDDRSAIGRLMARHLPWLLAWGRGRIPTWLRGWRDTADLVQETLLQSVRRLDKFENRGDGAFKAYLRQALMNRIRDEIRRAARQPSQVDLDSVPQLPDRGRSALDELIGEEELALYRSAIARLPEEDRTLIIARLHLGYSYEQVGFVTGKRSSDAARMAVRRALDRLTLEMNSVRK